jgi:hypothetical protein
MTPKTSNQNHPIALFSQPERRGALHKKSDLIDRFVKEPWFMASSNYLHDEKRIMALLMVMML